jgi:hypothetical protein
VQILDKPADFIRPRAEIAARFSTERTATEYEALFAEELERARQRKAGKEPPVPTDTPR